MKNITILAISSFLSFNLFGASQLKLIENLDLAVLNQKSAQDISIHSNTRARRYKPSRDQQVSIHLLLDKSLRLDDSLKRDRIRNTPLSNLKEDGSRYTKQLSSINQKYLFSRFGEQPIKEFLIESSLSKQNYFCATNWISNLLDSKFVGKSNKNKYVKTLILLMRKENIIDDIATGILLKARLVRNHFFLGASISELNLSFDRKKLQAFFEENLNGFDHNCGEDAWKIFRSKILKAHLFDKKEISLTNIIYYAKKHKYINSKQFEMLNKYRSSDVSSWSLTLKNYYRKRSSVEKVIDQNVTPSKFLSIINGKSDRSLRQRLYERYSSLQIKVLASILETMQKRFNANSANIQINYDDHNETINLNSMEQLRMNLKLMRKELNDLNNTNEFKSRPARYTDIIAAAYELNLVQSDEIEYLAKYQEIWNPKKTKAEKIMYWVSSMGSIGAIVLPEPFSFLTLMGLMLIEQKVTPNRAKLDKSYSIF